MALRIDKINLKATDVAALPVYGLITTGTNLNTLDGIPSIQGMVFLVSTFGVYRLRKA